MVSDQKCCPVCGKSYGLIDRITNPLMCKPCWQAQKKGRKASVDSETKKEHRYSKLAGLISSFIGFVIWFFLIGGWKGFIIGFIVALLLTPLLSWLFTR